MALLDGINAWDDVGGGTDNRLARYDGTDKIQQTGITADNSDNVSGMGTLGCGAITSSGAVHTTDGAMGCAPEVLVDAATVATDCSKSNVFTLSIGGNRVLGAPTNGVTGYTYIWIISQTGSYTLDVSNAVFEWPGGTEPVLTTGAGAVDIFTGVYDGSKFYMVAQQDFS